MFVVLPNYEKIKKKSILTAYIVKVTLKRHAPIRN